MNTQSPGVARLSEFGDTIFATMSALALEHKAVNLGQGFPDASGPTRMLEIAQEQIAAGNNQYAPLKGLPVMREAIAHQRLRDHNMSLDPDTEIVATVGATEGIAATILGLVEPGDEVIVFEPYYDAYAAAIALAGARRVAVPVVENGSTWSIDLDDFESALSDRTTMVIINNPHNPTGSVFDLAELAKLCVARDLLVLADEAYEYILFDDHVHKPAAMHDGMWERTVTVATAAKSFNVTGWKTGWAMGPAQLINEVTRAKQFLTFVGFTPVQPAIAHALEHERDWIHGSVAGFAEERTKLVQCLEDCGFRVHAAHGTYFMIADVGEPADEWCIKTTREVGVSAIPVTSFVDEPGPWKNKVRFTFCKDPSLMAQGRERMLTAFAG